MASGVVHNTVTTVAAALPPLAAVRGLVSWEYALLASVGCLMGILLTPDLDQPTTNRVEGVLLRSKVAPVALFGRLYVVFWLPYAKIFPHRSFWTHFPLVGTVGRLIYVAFGVGLVWEVVNYAFRGDLGVALGVLEWFWALIRDNPAIFVGLLLSDTCHWLLDMRWFAATSAQWRKIGGS